jgi:hypothetical protein
MKRPTRGKAQREPAKVDRRSFSAAVRDRLALFLGVVTFGTIVLTFIMSNGTQFLMPGPLASAHGAIENCGACHTKSGTGKVSWLQGLAVGDPAGDSKACLSCHKMLNTAFNPHGASLDTLKISTRRLTKVAAVTSAPVSARAQSIAFPMREVMAGGLNCATCHQEHKGVNFDLNKVTNAQCQSCHVVKFNSFDGNHPQFDKYPFERRTRITYDHASHFGKHFPEVAGKEPTKVIPATCANCHNTRADKRIMGVAPFTEVCTSCHLDQIIGKERVSGPKGIAFLTLPGLDLQTLKEKKAVIGEWPDTSEAALTPFMKVMISRTDRGRALIKTVNGLNLQDLSAANDEQIKAVTNLVWEIKGLFYALISGKASDVLGDLNIGGGTKLSAALVADLTASIPRDVVISAHQEWLPDLATEMANRQEPAEQEQSGWGAAITETRLSGTVSPEELLALDARQAIPRFRPQAASGEAASIIADPDRLAQAGNAPGTLSQGRRIDPVGRAIKGPDEEAEAVNARAAQPEGAGAGTGPADGRQRFAQARSPDQTDDLLSPSDASAPPEQPSASPAPAKDVAQPAARAAAPSASAAPAAAEQPQGRASGQNDDLLFPNGGAPEASSSAAPASAAPTPDAAPAAVGSPASADAAPSDPQARAGTVVSIKSDVDPESWAEYGGWYRQDFAIFYRPTGHKDKFIYSWLFLTGSQAAKGNTSPPATVFDYLIGKDAQGSCTKCHSVDDIKGKGRLVNFSPPKIETKLGSFTNFIHEPHFGIMENRGCLTCHTLGKGRPYLKSYEQGDPKNFASNFGPVKKELCQTCHTSSKASQDCLLCHKYHVNGVLTPITKTKIPVQ